MKILVTGGAGFIASHIVDRYVALGHEVLVVDNLSSGRREQVNPAARLVEADIRDPQVRELIRRERPEIVNHHAAQISVKVSTDRPAVDAEINVLGMIHLLEAAAAAGTRKFIFASSGGTIYGAPEQIPTPETAPMAPLSPYGITKAAGEFYLRFFQSDRGLTFTSLRYSNVYGPRQDPHGEAGVVAIFSRLLLRGETPTIHWDGEQQKDMVYVGDVARASELALAAGDNGAYNIGTGVGTSVNELFQAMLAITGGQIEPSYGPRRPGDLRVSRLDAGLAVRELGWRPQVPLAEGLRHTVDFFRAERNEPQIDRRRA